MKSKKLPFVVKIITDNEGNSYENSYWHHTYDQAATERTLCTGEAIGMGDSSVVYKERRGNITCPDCIEIIEGFKSIDNYKKPKK